MGLTQYSLVEQDAGRTILVVEDELAIRELITVLLRDEGYEVVDVPNGSVALETLEHIQPSLILLDINMPVMDGLTFMQVYQEAPGPHAPIVLVSALDTNIIHAEAFGVAGYLLKPFEIEKLLEIVHNSFPTTPASAIPMDEAMADALSQRLFTLLEQLTALRSHIQANRHHANLLLQRAEALQGRSQHLGVVSEEQATWLDWEALVDLEPPERR